MTNVVVTMCQHDPLDPRQMTPCVVCLKNELVAEQRASLRCHDALVLAQFDVARLTGLLHRVVMLLDASSCYSCGAEPGCNIDCGLCHLTAELQREGLNNG